MKKIVILGYGAVSKCLLPLIIKHICNPKDITIIDKGLSFHPIDISKTITKKFFLNF
jgi:homospermidine synthase